MWASTHRFFFAASVNSDTEMQNNDDFYTVHQKLEKHTPPPPLSYFSSHLPPAPVPKLTSLMHDPIAWHCGGIQHQPTTCSIKYGGMAFKAMLNAPDMGERERERAGRAAFVRKVGVGGWGGGGKEHMREERPRGTVGRNIVTFRS